ncbi:MAG: VOC family protein [Caulobacter sp.]|nr:VOC family protein [Caulobacter sp.]
MGNTIQITPFMHVGDLAATLDFFTQVVGFEVLFRSPGYAYIEREGAGIRILEAEGAPAPGRRAFRYYIDVRDLDAVHAELKPKLDTLPADHVFGPVDQAYGQRELLILAPDGDLLVFGAAIAKG